ncbi:MAG TPA: hypothetical protein VGO80_10425 [Solirubrobacteraceae bacterium]|jgi:hypothetical protein|nr:hypothetical protein [Solirubrobacteraceae bacterium]
MSAAGKRTVRATIVKLLTHTRTDRGMRLMDVETRALLRGEIHELVTTDQVDAAGGDQIDRVGFLGFAEIEAAGIVERGDRVHVAGVHVGTVLGFDDCHFPNHLNILIAGERLETARTLELTIESEICFEPVQG